MRPALLLALVACALQGCSVLGAGLAAGTNHQRLAASSVPGAEVGGRPPAPGDTLAIRLVGGEEVRGAFVGLSADSLALDAGSYALGDVAHVASPWKRAGIREAFLVGLLVDVAVVGLALSGGEMFGWTALFDFSGLDEVDVPIGL